MREEMASCALGRHAAVRFCVRTSSVGAALELTKPSTESTASRTTNRMAFSIMCLQIKLDRQNSDLISSEELELEGFASAQTLAGAD